MNHTSSIEPRGAVAALWRLWPAPVDSVRIEVEPFTLGTAAVQQLTQVERATVRIVAPPVESITVAERGVPIEAAIRLAIWHERNPLLSGNQLARNLQTFFHPYAHAARIPWRGWDLLWQIDFHSELHSVELWLSSDDPTAFRKYRKVRLCERISEITTARRH
jgi:hypothetical protein